jgi:hypothetical protein
MNPNREGSIPSFEQTPQLPTPEAGGQGQERTAEAPPAAPEQAGKQAPQPALPVVPDDIPAADQPVIAIPPQDLATVAPVDPRAIAHDKDRIEREWVDKAKSIIAQTRDDPYTQKHEMTRVKAEYIQKRFGKEIKTDEAAA